MTTASSPSKEIGLTLSMNETTGKSEILNMEYLIKSQIYLRTGVQSASESEEVNKHQLD
jgi:hypothetical protein